ncbi:ABC transporter ATP-binding protein [Polyangium sorediatum]|uniref:ABC transporter ATP-binding protein n=1 Tax=Polyangium sorediatum TaxID=889274 RepID=A0ABT6NSM4_9BACT|nr:ABC transporter ATP-binding protein [Polyangium sorediatum]MDI1431150.1 ABC transporter ATP-binding protein [Polyangium sorediatum]
MADVPLLAVEDLVVEYMTPSGPVRAVDAVSFVLARGEVLGLVGESGSGKSTVAQALARILGPPAMITAGRVLFEGSDVLAMHEDDLRRFRWRKMSFVLQSAMNALCPVLTIGEQIIDVLVTHERTSARAARERAAHLLELVGIDPARLTSHPHELSGGMRQRVGIALALALDPPLVIMDEPTTALDVVVQHEVLSKIAELKEKLGLSVLFITHDMSIVSQFATRIGVLYAGRLVEMAPTRELFRAPRHPYTKGLLGSFVSLHGPRRRLAGIPGSPPDLRRLPAGCAFRARCAEATARCATEAPVLRGIGEDHSTACHLVSP